jgi:uroporphyrinogen decarboxylase
MISRERILAAVDHKSPDILPVSFKASADVIRRLQAEFKADSLHNLIDSLPVDTYGLFNNCMIGVFPVYVGGPNRILYPDVYQDGTWDTIYGYKRRWIKSSTGYNEEVISTPLANVTDLDGLKKYDWPQADWFDYSSIAQQCAEAGNKAVIFLAGSLWQSANIAGFERILSDMICEPLFVETCFGKLGEFYVEFTERTLKAASGHIDIVCVQDDLGTQAGALISPEMYRRYFKPHHRKIYEVAHRFGVKVMQHSCGAVVDFIPDFLEIGVDILDPLQTSASGMEALRLKKEFGQDLCFHGGIDTQNTLIKGTPKDIRKEIDFLVSIFADDGGFILAPSHYIQSDTPWENVMALFEYSNQLRRS